MVDWFSIMTLKIYQCIRSKSVRKCASAWHKLWMLPLRQNSSLLSQTFHLIKFCSLFLVIMFAFLIISSKKESPAYKHLSVQPDPGNSPSRCIKQLVVERKNLFDKRIEKSGESGCGSSCVLKISWCHFTLWSLWSIC